MQRLGIIELVDLNCHNFFIEVKIAVYATLYVRIQKCRLSTVWADFNKDDRKKKF